MAQATLLGVLLGGMMILLSLLSVSADTNAPAAGTPDPAQGERRTVGSAEAPVVLSEWVDFQCPACRVFALSREPEIQRLYVDTGKVRLETHNFAFLGPESILAAEAAEAAADQGRYQAYRALLYQRQRGENQGAFSADNLKRFATELGLDRAAFDEALDRHTHRARVLAEKREGEALRVNATPTLFINGRKVEGVPSSAALRQMIDAELARKGAQ